jgi:hypothetical protein
VFWGGIGLALLVWLSLGGALQSISLNLSLMHFVCTVMMMPRLETRIDCPNRHLPTLCLNRVRFMTPKPPSSSHACVLGAHLALQLVLTIWDLHSKLSKNLPMYVQRTFRSPLSMTWSMSLISSGDWFVPEVTIPIEPGSSTYTYH